MAKLIIASVLSLLLLQFAFQGVDSANGDLGAACNNGACTDAFAFCDSNTMCKIKVDETCASNTDKCIDNAECDSTSTNCKCKSNYAINVAKTICTAGTAATGAACDSTQTAAATTCTTGTCTNSLCAGADGVIASLVLMMSAFVMSRFF